MIRKAIQDDIPLVTQLYNKAIDYEDSHTKYTSWQKGIYPTRDTARIGVNNSSLYILEEDNKILASVILDTRQPPEYRNISWEISTKPNGALVIHTLCVDPEYSGSGIGSALVDFIKQHAKNHGYPTIRLNTTKSNTPAYNLYQKNGFKIASIQKILLNGQIPCAEHLFMEFIL